MEHLDILIPLAIMVGFVLALLVWEPVRRWSFKRQMRLRDRASRKNEQAGSRNTVHKKR